MYDRQPLFYPYNNFMNLVNETILTGTRPSNWPIQVIN